LYGTDITNIKERTDANARTSAVMIQKWGGAAALFVYLQSELEGLVVALGVVVSIWQGILLWRGEVIEPQALEQI
jgi:hypothetical protein